MIYILSIINIVKSTFVFVRLYRTFEHNVCLCTDDLSKGRVATQSTSFAYSTSNIYLYKASNAVDRNITTCMRTEGIGGNSPEKTVWWEVDLGGVYNIYSVNILFRSYSEYDGFGIVHIFDKKENKKIAVLTSISRNTLAMASFYFPVRYKLHDV